MTGSMNKTALMFPGQGAQYVGMAKTLYDNYDIARKMIDRADDVLHARLSDIMFNGPPEELKLTKNTQPAIFLHSAVLVKLLEPYPFEVAAACGHSLGEYTALFCAGSLSFEDALLLVRERGLLMYESGMKRSGTMAAVMGLEAGELERICRENSENDCVVVPANFNCPGQLVISGDVETLRRTMSALEAAGARKVIELDVSGAFHSPLMEDASSGLEEKISRTPVKDARFPVISNATAKAVYREDEIREALVKQLTHPVQWESTMRSLLANGCDSFIELGPGRVLSGLLKRIDRSVRIMNADTDADMVRLKAVMGV